MTTPAEYLALADRGANRAEFLLRGVPRLGYAPSFFAPVGSLPAIGAVAGP